MTSDQMQNVEQRIKDRYVFVRCSCGYQYKAQTRFMVNSDYGWTCPECGNDPTTGDADEIDYVANLPELLPNGVKRHGEGINSYYTGLRD